MRFVGFLIRLFLVVALVVWLADRPGQAHIVWRDYAIDMSAAVLGLIVLAFAYAAVLLHRLWRFLWDGPRFWKLRRKIGKLEEGEGELAKGLAAIAAGQPVEAGRHAVKARQLMGETPISKLIQAQAAQLAGEEGAARSLFEALTSDPKTAVLGYRGLIVTALKRGDFEEAARAAQRLQQTGIDVPWLHLVRFEMGARLQNWALAEESLSKARKGKALPLAQANKNEAALLLARASAALQTGAAGQALVFTEKARKLAPEWLPAAMILAEAQIATHHGRAALRVIEWAWHKEPHPQLASLLKGAAGLSKPLDVFKHLSRMTRGTQDHKVALTVLGEAALEAKLWGEARRFLMDILGKGEATRQTYQLLARLERSEGGKDEAASVWLAKASAAPADPVWLCGACGASHESWTASCDFCGAFNRIGWDVPGQGRRQDAVAKTDLLGFWG